MHLSSHEHFTHNHDLYYPVYVRNRPGVLPRNMVLWMSGYDPAVCDWQLSIGARKQRGLFQCNLLRGGQSAAFFSFGGWSFRFVLFWAKALAQRIQASAF